MSILQTNSSLHLLGNQFFCSIVLFATDTLGSHVQHVEPHNTMKTQWSNNNRVEWCTLLFLRNYNNQYNIIKII